MNKAREISNFQKYQTIFCDRYTLKRLDREMFLFWVNDIFVKKQALIVAVPTDLLFVPKLDSVNLI